MKAKQKTPSPIAWALGQTGGHKGQYVMSVFFAIVGVAFSVAPYFVVVGIVRGLMEGNKDLSYYLICCHEFISALPDGYDTVVGEGGANLSGGERQRISIARAMMKDAPVIFLDEATANVDPENENDLMRAIQALTAEKTVIMIAHRLKTVEHADQILVVDHGRIVQQGTHASLMEQEGIYKDFIGQRREAASWKVKQ